MNETSSSDTGDMSTPWGPAIGAAVVVQLATLSGILILALSALYRQRYCKEQDSEQFSHLLWTLQHLVVPSFAAGALLATTVFLIVPEALTLLAGGHEEEEATSDTEEDHDHRILWSRQLTSMVVRALVEGNETDHSEEDEDHADEEEEHAHGAEESEIAWKFGAAVLGGFIFPILLGALFPEPEVLLEQLDSAAAALEEKEKSLATYRNEVTDYDVDDPNVSDDSVPQPTLVSNSTVPLTTTSGLVEKPNASTAKAIPMVVKTKNISLATSVLVGDFFHNLADGFFIGSAFLLCSKSIGWTIVATTIYHEVAQEIADYVLLTVHCGLTVVQALLLNFISGCSVMLGVIIVLSIDLEESVIGVVLSVSAGVYLYIAVGECIPRVQDVLRSADIPHDEKMRRTLTFFAFFVLGAVPIGLVLLNHGHCEAE